MPILLVTGGTGYLGRELVRIAPTFGWQVRATCRTQEPRREAEWLRLDVRDAEAVRVAAAGVDAVVHTAYRQGEDAWSAAVAAAARGSRLVHLSSDVVFDGTRGGYVEETVPAPVNAYGRSKAEAERRVADLHPEAAIVRTSLIYGGREPGPQELLARTGARFFVDEIRSPVQVEDLARAVLEIVELDHAGPLHVAGSDDVSRFDFAVLLGADPARIEAARTTPDRAPNVSLDSARARSLLRTKLRGVREVLA
jgi:dTDP-4-dehydrorhamnose reductase